MPSLGIIGSGNIGAAIARRAVAAGIPVIISNSRGPETLISLASELGPLVSAGTVEEAAASSDIVVLSVPHTAHTTIPAALLKDRTVLDTSNYYPFRDGRIDELDEEKKTTSELVQHHFQGARLVKAFNNILAHHIPQLARPTGAPDRTALPIAGDDAKAKDEAAKLINSLGYDTVDAGSLAESWRFEPDAAAYTRLYLADPATPGERMLEAPGGTVPAAQVRIALMQAERVRVAERAY